MPTDEDFDADLRLDPRARLTLQATPTWTTLRDVESRERLVEQMHHPKAVEQRERTAAFWALLDTDDVASFAGLRVSTEEYTSEPDGNRVRVLVVRPDTDEELPCVNYLHGGGMQTGSAFAGRFPPLARTIAANGVVVTMPDFRNCLVASTSEEVAPYPAGLDDCVSSVRWLHAEADRLGVDTGRIVVSGESGGGNLAIATGMRLLRDGDMALVNGLYPLCPFIAGSWPQERYPSSIENDGYYLSLGSNRSAMAYGIEAFEAGDPLAWPAFASEDDVRGLVRTFVSVNECDPLRDEGVEFYRLLLRAGVAAQCRVVMGTGHAMDTAVAVLPDVTRETAASIARYATDPA
jgi:acetyl esterase/lipase